MHRMVGRGSLGVEEHLFGVECLLQMNSGPQNVCSSLSPCNSPILALVLCAYGHREAVRALSQGVFAGSPGSPTIS